MQDFLREESLCDFVAEILDTSITSFQHSSSVEFMLKYGDALIILFANHAFLSSFHYRTVGSKQYADKDQDKLSKATSKFLLKFAELQPKEIMKQMVHLNDLLDSEVFVCHLQVSAHAVLHLVCYYSSHNDGGHCNYYPDIFVQPRSQCR